MGTILSCSLATRSTEEDHLLVRTCQLASGRIRESTPGTACVPCREPSARIADLRARSKQRFLSWSDARRRFGSSFQIDTPTVELVDIDLGNTRLLVDTTVRDLRISWKALALSTICDTRSVRTLRHARALSFPCMQKKEHGSLISVGQLV